MSLANLLAQARRPLEREGHNLRNKYIGNENYPDCVVPLQDDVETPGTRASGTGGTGNASASGSTRTTLKLADVLEFSGLEPVEPVEPVQWPTPGMIHSLRLGTETPETLPDRLIALGRTLLRVLLEEQVEAMAQAMMADPTYRITDQAKALDYFRANARSRLSATTNMVARTGLLVAADRHRHRISPPPSSNGPMPGTKCREVEAHNDNQELPEFAGALGPVSS